MSHNRKISVNNGFKNLCLQYKLDEEIQIQGVCYVQNLIV